jgi:uroporphyrinogen III methyltransferase/synthase
MGAQVDVAPVYQTIAGEIDEAALSKMLAAGEIDLVTFTSSSTVTNLLQLLGNQAALLQAVKTVCIGPITAKTCIDHKIEPAAIADNYTIEGLVEAIKGLLSK